MASKIKGLFGRKNDGVPQFPRVSSAAGEARIPSASDLSADERLGVAFDAPATPDFEGTAKRLVSAAAAHPAFHESGVDQYPRTLLAELGAYLSQVDAGFIRYRTELEATHRASLAAELERCDNRLAELTFGKRDRAAGLGEDGGKRKRASSQGSRAYAATQSGRASGRAAGWSTRDRAAEHGVAVAESTIEEKGTSHENA